ncbi:MAG: gamma-glutamyl-gamma-aminobutyrate hydrolase family protein [Dehalococcoidia bacterium]|nr:gamma-glutamyl-gamma-aminobutyrate hydrolase family protein [Dehalococcoidia bacterium]
MPLIAVIASNERDAEQYLEAVRAHGAETLLLLPGQHPTPDEILARADGLLITGRPDVQPSEYGATPDPDAGVRSSPGRDTLELPLLRAALARDLPILAICRGMQALNVLFGGRLLQDLPGHRADAQGNSAFHHIWIAPGSKLAAAIGSGGLVKVNSIHHQGLREAQKAPALMASAYSPDDRIVEGLESPKHTWVVGVQFHPERKNAKGRWECPPQFQGLFATLARKAGERVNKVTA